MANCDVCSTPGQGQIVKASVMSAAVKAGFNPHKAGLAPDLMAVAGMGSSYDQWRQSAINGVLSRSDWNVCEKCMAVLRPFLQTETPSPKAPVTAVSSSSVDASQFRLEKGYTLIDVQWVVPTPLPMPKHCAACAKDMIDQAIGKEHHFSFQKREAFMNQVQTWTFSGTAYLCSSCASLGEPTDFLQVAFSKEVAHTLLHVGNPNLAQLWREALEPMCKAANDVWSKKGYGPNVDFVRIAKFKRMTPGQNDWQAPCPVCNKAAAKRRGFAQEAEREKKWWQFWK